MRIVRCTFDRHAAAILAIFNEAILTSTALFDYQPRAPETMVAWFETKAARNFPVVGVESDDGTLLGFASYGSFRAWPAYKYTVEHSVYVLQGHRGNGIGRVLLQRLVEEARAQEYHLLVGGIEATNRASIALHESLGFTHAGTIRQAGFKFGRWLDLAFYQRLLDTPRNPTDG